MSCVLFNKHSIQFEFNTFKSQVNSRSFVLFDINVKRILKLIKSLEQPNSKTNVHKTNHNFYITKCMIKEQK